MSVVSFVFSLQAAAHMRRRQEPRRSLSTPRVFLCFFSAILAFPAVALKAQMTGAPNAGFKREPGMTASAIPAPLREIGFDQRLDERLPLDTPLGDEAGRGVHLGDYFGRRPVVLVFAYYDCPMLCTLAINGLSSALNVMSLRPGTDFEIVTISIDPRDTPATARSKKSVYLERYTRAGAADAWHFLTGNQSSIDHLTKAAGFRYAWDRETQQFAHPTGIIVLTPDGRMARYLFGIEYGPRDLRLAIVEASSGKIGSPVAALLLYCYHYDPMTGRYGLAIMRAMRIAGATTVVVLGGFIFVALRREREPTTKNP